MCATTVAWARWPHASCAIRDFGVAETWARLRLVLRESGMRMPVTDSWITATAMTLGVPVVTQDDDYVEVGGLAVIRV